MISMIDAKILVIIPAYNEQASIARVIERVKESVPAADILSLIHISEPTRPY